MKTQEKFRTILSDIVYHSSPGLLVQKCEVCGSDMWLNLFARERDDERERAEFAWTCPVCHTHKRLVYELEDDD